MKTSEIVKKAALKAKSFTEAEEVPVQDLREVADMVVTVEVMLEKGHNEGFVMEGCHLASKKFKSLSSEEISDQEKLDLAEALVSSLSKAKADCEEKMEEEEKKKAEEEAAAKAEEEAAAKKAEEEAAAEAEEEEKKKRQQEESNQRKPWASEDLAAHVVRTKNARRERLEADQVESRRKKAKSDKFGEPDSFSWGQLEDGKFKG